MAAPSPYRRRQRSVRVTVAAGLLAVATLVVLLTLPTQSVAWLSASSVFALVCGMTSSRIIYSELAQSRREAAADRAAQAQAYRVMFTERAEEHAEFTTAMTGRLADRERDLRDLEEALVVAEKRAIEAETRVQREARRANDAQDRVTRLQEALEIRRAEEADELATWDGAGEALSVADLLEWEGAVTATVQSADASADKKRA